MLRQYQFSGAVIAGAGSLLRVLRGGAFWNDHQHVRCAYRNRNNARNLNDNYGMRVVLAACTYFGTRTSRRGAV